MNEYGAVLNRRSLRWSRLLQESPHVEKSLTGDRSATQHLRFGNHVCVCSCRPTNLSQSEKVRAQRRAQRAPRQDLDGSQWCTGAAGEQPGLLPVSAGCRAPRRAERHHSCRWDCRDRAAFHLAARAPRHGSVIVDVVNNTRKRVQELFIYHPDIKLLVDRVKIPFFRGGSDLHRTFPDNILFKSEASLQSSLFNVLLAYGHHNKAVGYCQVKSVTSSAFSPVLQRLSSACPGLTGGLEENRRESGVCVFQGMNFIAGYLIIITKDEEKSFWLMDALLAKMLPGIWKELDEINAAKPAGKWWSSACSWDLKLKNDDTRSAWIPEVDSTRMTFIMPKIIITFHSYSANKIIISKNWRNNLR